MKETPPSLGQTATCWYSYVGGGDGGLEEMGQETGDSMLPD